MTVVRFGATGIILTTLACSGVIAAEVSSGTQRSIAELTPDATIHLGKTADWVAITDEAVWVGSTGPNAVSEIDPQTNKLLVTIQLPGAPCAGLTVGFGGLWVPLCGKPNSLVRVDLHTRKVTAVPGVGPAGPEGGITASRDSVWLVVNPRGSLARIDPNSLRIRQTVSVPAGSYNPLYGDGSPSIEDVLVQPDVFAVFFVKVTKTAGNVRSIFMIAALQVVDAEGCFEAR